MNTESQLAEALWLLAIEYGGNRDIDAINPHIRQAFDRALSLLEESGCYQRGQGFRRQRSLSQEVLG